MSVNEKINELNQLKLDLFEKLKEEKENNEKMKKLM
jgi:hypothetical protein